VEQFANDPFFSSDAIGTSCAAAQSRPVI